MTWVRYRIFPLWFQADVQKVLDFGTLLTFRLKMLNLLQYGKETAEGKNPLSIFSPNTVSPQCSLPGQLYLRSLLHHHLQFTVLFLYNCQTQNYSANWWEWSLYKSLIRLIEGDYSGNAHGNTHRMRIWRILKSY